MYYRTTGVIYFGDISGFSHLRAQDVTSSVKGHHMLLTTQRAITNLISFFENAEITGMF